MMSPRRETVPHKSDHLNYNPSESVKSKALRFEMEDYTLRDATEDRWRPSVCLNISLARVQTQYFSTRETTAIFTKRRRFSDGQGADLNLELSIGVRTLGAKLHAGSFYHFSNYSRGVFARQVIIIIVSSSS